MINSKNFLNILKTAFQCFLGFYFLVSFVFCTKDQFPDDLSNFYIQPYWSPHYYPYTNNFLDERKIESGDSVFLEIHHWISEEQRDYGFDEWRITTWWVPAVDPDLNLEYQTWESVEWDWSKEEQAFTNTIIITTAGESKNTLWELQEGVDFSIENKEKTSYGYFLKLHKWKDGDSSSDDDETDCNTVILFLYIGDGPSPEEAADIRIYCGHHRYGISGEGKLDYPIAYPIVAQVIGEYGNPVPGVSVHFSVTGPANFEGGAWQHTGTSGTVTIGGDNTPGKETVGGAVKCPIVITGSGDITVTAYIDEPSSGYQDVFFYAKGVDTEDEYNESVNDSNNFHERYPESEELVYYGDGLWGNCFDSSGAQISIDNNTGKKNLRLEIDYLRDDGNLNLTPKDMKLIYQKVSEIFAQVDIELDSKLLLDPDEGDNFLNIDGRQDGSIIRAMDKETHWSDALIYSSLLKDYVLKSGEYTDQDCQDIFYLTRGVFGEEIWNTDPSRDMGKWERVRLHIAILPGKYKDPETGVYPAGLTWSLFPSAYYSSGAGCFYWTDSDPTKPEITVDSTGICIYTGNFPQLSDVNAEWICNEVIDGEPANEYCYILAYIIAHEIGHAIGLDHEPDDPYQLMYGTVNFRIDNPGFNEAYKMTTIHIDNQDKDFFINLRKVLGREVITNKW